MLMLMLVLIIAVQGCEDTRTNCGSLVKFCTVHVSWLEKMCPKSCGYCTGVGEKGPKGAITAVEKGAKGAITAGEEGKGAKGVITAGEEGKAGVADNKQGVTIVRPSKAKKAPKQALFETQILTRHNEKRQLHNTTPLVWSKVAAKRARAWCWNLLKTQSFEHRPDNVYGENLYRRQGLVGKLAQVGALAAEAWYNEVKGYTWGLTERERWEEEGNVTGHFTQLVWRTSKEVGCGYAARKGVAYVCCNYGPKGNRYGQYEENVLPISVGANRKDGDKGNGKVITEEEEGEAVCADLSRSCAKYSKHCATPRYKSWLYKYCKKTCNHCQVNDNTAGNSADSSSGGRATKGGNNVNTVGQGKTAVGKATAGSVKKVENTVKVEFKKIPAEKTEVKVEKTVPVESEKPAVKASCVDVSQYCARYIAYCTDRVYTPWLSVNCRLTCNMCYTAEKVDYMSADKVDQSADKVDQSADKVDQSADKVASFSESVLSAHNQLRSLHGVADLTWSKVLEQHAKTHCDRLSQGARFTSSTGTNHL